MKVLGKVGEFLVLMYLALATFLFSVLLYVKRLWPDADYEQIMMTLKDISFDLIVKHATGMDYVWGSLFFVVVFPLIYFYLNVKNEILMALLLSVSVAYFSGYIDYKIYSNTKSLLYEEEYVEPHKIAYQFPQKKRNLLMIYLESFESNFVNDEYYGANLIPNLEKLQKEGEFSLEYRNMPGANYSIASLIASNCAIPLRYSKERDLWEAKFFLPQVSCMPEVLKNNGYQTAIIKAADITFTNVNLFAEQHGFDKALGVDEIRLELGEEGFEEKLGTFGGVRDRVLYEFAKKKIDEFDKDKPFMLTLFSLDTHTPSPFVEKDCVKKFGDVRDAFMCADKSVADFVEWFKNTPYWENTTVVVMGDHLFPSKMKGQEKARHRGIYNVFLNLPEGLLIKKDKVFSTFDMVPSILESLGIKISPRGFGLGRSLFADDMSLMEKLGSSKFKIKLMQKSDVYDKFLEPKIKRVDVYNDYQLGEELSGKDVVIYTDAYLDTLGRYYVDRLNFNLLGYDGGDITLELKFYAIVGHDSGIKIFANDELIKEAKYSVGERQPYVYKVKIRKELIKDGKLMLKFRNFGGGSRKEHRLGVSIDTLKLI